MRKRRPDPPAGNGIAFTAPDAFDAFPVDVDLTEDTVVLSGKPMQGIKGMLHLDFSCFNFTDLSLYFTDSFFRSLSAFFQDGNEFILAAAG